MADTKDERIAELEAELRQRDDVPEGHGWLPQSEWQRLLDVQKRRAEAAERRADALERALREIRTRPPSEEYEIARAALAHQELDQPAQDGGWQLLTGEPDDQQPCLLWHSDWVDLDFNPTGVREGFWGPHPDDPDQECWIVARWNPCHDVYETERAEPQPTHRMPMPQPPTDQPADAGGADAYDGPAIPETTWQVVDELSGAADAGDPSCCARTREECAQVANRRADELLSLANEAQREGAVTASYDLRREAGQVRKVVAAIRRTGDTP